MSQGSARRRKIPAVPFPPAPSSTWKTSWVQCQQRETSHTHIRYFPFLIGVDKINRNTLNPIGWELVAKGQSLFDSIASQHQEKLETVHAVPPNRAHTSAEVIKMIKHHCIHSAHTAHCEKLRSCAPTKPWRFSIIAR